MVGSYHCPNCDRVLLTREQRDGHQSVHSPALEAWVNRLNEQSE